MLTEVNLSAHEIEKCDSNQEERPFLFKVIAVPFETYLLLL